MAQIREFESTTESYFILDGVSYPKVYEAMLDNGYSDTKIKLVGTNRDTTPLVFSTEYTNILVDGEDFDTASEAISRLNQVVFSKGGGSGGGGTTGDYIPLGGTEEGKPVTGYIEFTKNSYNKGFIQINEETDVENKINFNLESGVFIASNRPNEGLYNAFGISSNGQFSINSNNPTSKGFRGTAYYGANYDDNTYIQKIYTDKQHSYSLTEYKTGGKWIDGKDIYKITQLTADTPPTMETVFPTEVIGTYTVYKYTKP